MMLITHQTGPEGKKVAAPAGRAGLPASRASSTSALVLDRETRRVAVMASTEGGVDIEEVAAKHPEKILKVWIDPLVGLQPFQARQIAFGLGLVRRRAQGSRQAAAGALRASS